MTRTKWAAVIGFGLGAVLGIVGTRAAMGWSASSFIAFYYSSVVAEMAVNASQIRAGRSDEALRWLDIRLPASALKLHKLHPDPEWYTGAMWQVQRYYEENPDLPVPADLRAILDDLPPRPPTSCKITAASQTASTMPADSQP